MGKINVETCEIEGLKIITPTVYGDARGYFMLMRASAVETSESTM